jgi:SAM-dependent methyltransferase
VSERDAPDWSRAAVEERTRRWLDETLNSGVAAKFIAVEDRIYDPAGQPQHMSRYHFQTLQRKLKIFRWLDRLRPASFIDIGSGSDHYPHLVRTRYGAEAFYSDLVHAMNVPYGGTEFGKVDRAVTLNLASLPFADGAFDVVLASEVLEHLVRPVEAIAELLRITRKCLVMTSLEAYSPSWLERLVSHHRVDVRVPHVERNFFLARELRALFGPAARFENLLYDPALPASTFAGEAREQAAYAALRQRDALVDALCAAVAVSAHGPGAMGVLVVCPKDAADAPPIPDPAADRALAGWLVEQAAAIERAVVDLLVRLAKGQRELPDEYRPVADSLLAWLRCPDCRGALGSDGPRLRCARCAAGFTAQYGVPILYPTRPLDDARAAAEAIDRLSGGDASRRRIVSRLQRRLRRNEATPGALRRGAWRLARTLGFHRS